jgi:hypothetical protein
MSTASHPDAAGRGAVLEQSWTLMARIVADDSSALMCHR